jgi:subtilisin family serine protease
MARYVIARRVADQEPTRARLKRATLSTLRRQVASFGSIIDTGVKAKADEIAETITLEGDAADVEAKRKELPENFIIETEKLRRPGVFHPVLSSTRSPEEFPIGLGATAEVNVSCAGKPLPAAQIVMTSIAYRGGFATTTFGDTDENGRALLPFNPSVWMPASVTILPRGRAWPVSSRIFGRRLNIAVPPLPREGPLAWWHRVMGLNRFSESLGEGIRVGVVDTGVGPHPYLSHVRSAGAFKNGRRLQNPGSSNDVAEHGTHVAGLIGARPPSGSKDFAGIAPGVDLVAARIYQGGGPPTQESGTTTNGDVAQAILTLARDEECDLINLSSGGPMRSSIEADRITAARNRGTLVICSVGNGSGPPVLYPAAEPEAVAVSALGPTGGIPFGVLDNVAYPMQWDRYSAAGFFAPAFISVGPETKCTGPGVGIISTVPARPSDEAPYVAMSGTSMGAPAVTGALAAILSQDSTYLSLPRTRERSSYALTLLWRAIRTLDLNFQYQGFGMPVIQGS